MVDEVDRAQAREQELRDDALRDVRRKTAEANHGAERCQECDSRIPPARRKAVPGVKLCVECQGLVEKKKKGWYADSN